MASLYDKCVTNDKKTRLFYNEKRMKTQSYCTLYVSKIVNSIDKATRKRKQNKY